MLDEIRLLQQRLAKAGVKPGLRAFFLIFFCVFFLVFFCVSGEYWRTCAKKNKVKTEKDVICYVCAAIFIKCSFFCLKKSLWLFACFCMYVCVCLCLYVFGFVLFLFVCFCFRTKRQRREWVWNEGSWKHRRKR